jgi:hypothetical protein
MAGAGYKLFATGDVLTAAQVNTYLQEQAVMVFADAAARTTALSGVLAEGMVTYLKDTDALEIYSGSAWVGYGSGDITGVTAGTGISGGGTSGTVTITNSMATEITAAGDIIIGTGSGTFDNLPIGTTGQVLTADTTVSPYKVKWASAAGGGGKVLQVVSTIKTDTFSQSSTSTLTDITGLSVSITPSSNTSKVFVIAHIGVSDVSAGSGLGFALIRGSTKIGAGDTAGSRNTVIAGGLYDPERANPIAFSYLDSPSTTSSTTYKIQMYNNNATGYVNRTHTDSDSAAYPRGSSTITVWEIGA